MNGVPQTRLEVTQTQKLSQTMQTAVHLLSLDLDGMSEEMLKAVAENPALEYIPPAKPPQEYAMRVKTRFGGHASATLDVDSGDLPAKETGLDELRQQICLCGLDEKTERVAKQMLEMLTGRGYFPQDLTEFSQEAGVPMEVARNALAAVQSLEPAGVGARSLEECLSLQLQDKENVDPLCYDLVKFHLLDIGKGNLREITKATGASLTHVRQCVEVIRALTPSPVSLSREETQYIMPEFSVECGTDGDISIVFHNDYFPSFRQDENFSKLAQTLTGEEREYAKKMQSSAQSLLRAAEMRQTTMEKLAGFLVREQRPYFLGQYSLLPLRVEDAASSMDVHESTVYRAIQGKYLSCARGLIPLSQFFQREVSGGISVAHVKELIREICASQTKLSDRAISEALAQRGITLSRRTVAKYRSQMDISAASRRNAEEKERS